MVPGLPGVQVRSGSVRHHRLHPRLFALVGFALLVHCGVAVDHPLLVEAAGLEHEAALSLLDVLVILLETLVPRNPREVAEEGVAAAHHQVQQVGPNEDQPVRPP